MREAPENAGTRMRWVQNARSNGKHGAVGCVSVLSGARARIDILVTMYTSMNLRNGSFLKPFNKLAVRVLSGIKK